MTPESDSPAEPIVMAISMNDEAMKMAYRTASDTMDDFIRHLAIGDSRLCSFKLCFRDPELSERLGEDRLLYWWLDLATYHPEDGHFSGVFSELPDCLLPYHQVGQRLHAEREDVFDWRVNCDGRLYGGFTIRVARQKIPADDLADYDSYIGVTSFEEVTSP
jgi:uncharacterized protein YegJ (DUF2314 family)